MSGRYPEIEKLREIYETYRIKIEGLAGNLCGISWYKPVLFKAKRLEFTLYVDDEYKDLEVDEPLLHLELVLRELEDYDDAEDYLQWCTWKGITPQCEQARQYHMGLSPAYRELAAIMPLEACISSLDFELNAGAAQFLRLGNQ